MPRGGGRSSSGNRSGGGGGGGFFNRGPARPAAAAPRPAPRPAAAPMQQAPAQGGGMMSGMGGMVMTGMALGAGSEVGHMAVKGLMGGGSSGSHGAPAEQQQQQAPQQYAQQDQMQQQVQQDPCAGYNQNFVQCLKSSESNIGLCQDYMNMLQQCQKDQSMGGMNFQ